MTPRCHAVPYCVLEPGVVERCPGCPDCADTAREIIKHRRANGEQVPVTASEEAKTMARKREKRQLRWRREKEERVKIHATQDARESEAGEGRERWE